MSWLQPAWVSSTALPGMSVEVEVDLGQDALNATVHDHGGVERPFLRRPAETRPDLHGVHRDHGDLVGTPPGSVLLILYALSTQPQNQVLGPSPALTTPHIGAVQLSLIFSKEGNMRMAILILSTILEI